MYKQLCDQLKVPNIDFDFHRNCSSPNRLEGLIEKLNPFLKSHGYFCYDVSGKSVLSKQIGLVRTNCIDSLDRTNVVQSEIGKQVLIMQIKALNHAFSRLPRYIEATFANIWADNADALSMEYSGTPALKTDFTRTGKRTIRGMLNDGYYSLQRYVLGNFYDGFNQDSLDLFHCNYQADLRLATFEPLLDRLMHQKLILLPITSLLCLLMVLFNLIISKFPSEDYQVNLLFWFAGFGASICGALMYGDNIVDRPKLTY